MNVEVVGVVDTRSVGGIGGIDPAHATGVGSAVVDDDGLPLPAGGAFAAVVVPASSTEVANGGGSAVFPASYVVGLAADHRLFA